MIRALLVPPVFIIGLTSWLLVRIYAKTTWGLGWYLENSRKIVRNLTEIHRQYHERLNTGRGAASYNFFSASRSADVADLPEPVVISNFRSQQSHYGTVSVS